MNRQDGLTIALSVLSITLAIVVIFQIGVSY